MDDVNYYFRDIPNFSAMPQHLFLKRAQKCNSYFHTKIYDNLNSIWFDKALPDIIIMRYSDGWELTFPYDSIDLVYHSFIKRDKYYMWILKSFDTKPQNLEYKYTLGSTPVLKL